MKFHTSLFASLLIALIMVTAMTPPVRADQLPTRDSLTITTSAATAVTVGTWKNGTFDTVNIWDCTPTNAVLTVSQVYTAGELTVTGTLATVTGNLSGNGSATVTAGYLLPGDVLLFQFASASTGTVSYVRRVGN
jgi:hypothetical protein